MVLTIQATKERTLAIFSDLGRCQMQLEQNGSTTHSISQKPIVVVAGGYAARPAPSARPLA